jgi:magnesium chelatase subunit D
MSAPTDASLAASLFAIDPAGTGGVCIRSPVHPARDQWLQMLKDLLPSGVPFRRIPFNIADQRLLGGLDLAATLNAGRPIAERGALAATDGGVLVVSMAERLTSHTAACINAVLDTGEAIAHREGVLLRDPARTGIVALDEGMSEEEFIPASLLDRLGFLIDFDGWSVRTILPPLHGTDEIRTARQFLPNVRCDSATPGLICAVAMALGVESLRMSMLAVRVARAAAALDGRTLLREEDAVLAARLVLAPRATNPPASHAQSASADRIDGRNSPPEAAQAVDSAEMREGLNEGGRSDAHDRVIEAAQAAIPSGLLARLHASSGRLRSRLTRAGKFGAPTNAGARGQPRGVASGMPRGDARLNLMETLRAAAPWQKLRGRNARRESCLRISRQDLRVVRHKQRSQTLTIFAVDASGSSALHRLAEAKGAVELLLTECYVRRDQVAVIVFRGRRAEIVLPPTRSLVRAKRSLGNMVGGGGTPLATAIDIAARVAFQALRRGDTPTIVVLTDGRANVLRDGSGGREEAQAEALRAADAVRAARIGALLIDTSPRPSSLAEDLAARMSARYIALPFASARALSDFVNGSRATSP